MANGNTKEKSPPHSKRARRPKKPSLLALASLTMVWYHFIQAISITQGTCNFASFSGIPMTELVSIKVAGSAYFMLGSQDKSGNHRIIDSDCNVATEVPPVYAVGNTNVGFHGQGGPFSIDTLLFRGAGETSSVSRSYSNNTVIRKVFIVRSNIILRNARKYCIFSSSDRQKH
jgi:hypothetical protein